MNRALLVGINRYPGAPLSGCVNDIRDMAEFLVAKCGFASHDIRLLSDARATTAGIKDRLQWLAGGLKAGDRVLFHYSGHGSQLPVRNAQGVLEKNHDVICPVDFDFTLPHAITDVDFQGLFANIPRGVEFNWISDSCHSGDLARAMPRVGRRPKSFPMPADIAWRVETARDDGIEPLGFSRSIEHLNGALISGCRSDQTSADAVFGGRPNGALTYFLLKALGETLLSPLKAVVDSTVRALEAGGYDQVPQLRGDPGITGKSFLAVSKTTPTSPRKTAVAVTVPPPIAAVPGGALSEIFDALAKIAAGHAEAGRDGGGGETAAPQGTTVSGNITVHF